MRSCVGSARSVLISTTNLDHDNAMTATRFYYGWVIVIAAFLAMFTTSAVTSNSQSVFLSPMTHDLGWSRADFTWGQTIGTFIMSGAGFVVGSYLDAKGPRLFMLGG